MNFSDAFQHLQNGNRIARKDWDNKTGAKCLFLDRGVIAGRRHGSADIKSPVAIGSADLLATDWYVWRPGFYFDTALLHLRVFKKIARSGWKDSSGKTYIQRVLYSDKLLIHFPEGNSKPWTPYHDELLKGDWYLVD